MGTSAWSRLAGLAARAAARGGPVLLSRVRAGRIATGRDGTGRDGTGRDGTGRDGTGRDGTPRRPPAPRRGRPPVRASGPQGGRSLVYAPQLDGRADPGEVVWTWVDYEEQDGRGKDRPVLVVGREGTVLLGLMLSSRQARDDQEHWLALGPGAWDSAARPSWVRLDRVLEVPEDGIRREGAVLDPRRFEQVAQALRAAYGWS